MKKIVFFILIFCFFLTGCQPNYIITGGENTQKDFDLSVVDDELYGVYDENSKSFVASPGQTTLGYFDDIMAHQKNIKLKKGNYSFIIEASIDNNIFASNSTYFENDMVAQMRVIDVKTKEKFEIASQEIYRRDFVKASVFQELALNFTIDAKETTVDFEVKYLNLATIAIKKMYFKSIKPSEVLTQNLVGYFAESENDKKLTYDDSKLYYLDLYNYVLPIRDSRFSYDVINMVSTLQGLVNRNGEHLFIRFNSPNYHQYNQDDFWLKELSKAGNILAGKEVVNVEKPATLLRLFKDKFEGVVVWDEKVPATSNVAATVCGVENLLSARYDENSQSLYNILVNVFSRPVKVNLYNKFFNNKEGLIWDTNMKSTLSAKNDAYRWAYDKYLLSGKTNAKVNANHLDAFSWDKSGLTVSYYNLQQQALANKDYYIMNKAFFWDLYTFDDAVPTDDKGQKIGTDFATLDMLMTQQNYLANGEMFIVGGFVPWWIKYTDKVSIDEAHADVESEWHWATELGKYYGVKDADAYGYTSVANCSIYSKTKIPEKGYKQEFRNSKRDNSLASVKLRAQKYIDANGKVIPKNYCLLYMGDYDAGAWSVMAMPKNFTDPKRGNLPLMWPINPAPANRVPNVYKYMYERQGVNDYFVGDHNGYGYLDIIALENPNRPSNLKGTTESFFRDSKTAWDYYDLDFQGFLINTEAPAVDYSQNIYRLMSDLSPYGVVYCGAGGQISFHKDSKGNEVPWTYHMDLSQSSPYESAQLIINRIRPIGSSPAFISLRSILKTPSYMEEVISRVNSDNPEYKLTPVDPYVYNYLVSIQNGKTTFGGEKI